MPRIRRWLIVAGLLCTACASQDLYPPAIPDPLMVPEAALLPCLPEDPLRLGPAPEPPLLPSELPPEDEWKYWRPQLKTKQDCWGKGKKRTCREVAIPTVDAVNRDTVIRATRARFDYGNKAMLRFTFLPGKTYEILTAPHSATFIYLPPGESLATPPPINTNEKTHDSWAFALAEQRRKAEDRREVLMVRPNNSNYETTTGLVLRSGETIPIKLVATETTSTQSVTWDMPREEKPPEVPVDQRPPKVELGRLHTGYTITPQGKTSPPWVPVAVFDDGSRTYIKFREALTYTRAPSAYGLNQKGAMNLVQSHMFVFPQHPEKGAILLVQGLWPALELKDTTGLSVKVVRQSLDTGMAKEKSYVPIAPTVAPSRPPAVPAPAPVLRPARVERRSPPELGVSQTGGSASLDPVQNQQRERPDRPGTRDATSSE